MIHSRIVHVVTYASASGAYGGPLTVARTQCSALSEGGREVTLFAGWDGSEDARDGGAAYEQRFFRTRRFRDSFASAFSWQLLAELLRGPKDAMYHVHLAREGIPLSVGLALAVLGRSYVVQPHGMLVQDKRTLLRIIDKLFLRFIIRRAAAVIALSRDEVERLQFLAPLPSRTYIVPNAVPIRPSLQKTLGSTLTVGFVARLHPRKDVMLFARTAKLLLTEDPHAYVFKILGADEGDLGMLLSYLKQENLSSSVHYDGTLPSHRVSAYLRGLDVLVAPAQNEPFGMSALEALAESLPVVMSDDAGLFDYIGSSPALIASRPNVEHLADAIGSVRLNYTERRSEAAEAVRRAGLDTTTQARKLTEIYDQTHLHRVTR